MSATSLRPLFTILIKSLFFLALIHPTSLHAYSFLIDNFEVSKNGSVLFTDSFSDGSPPPSAPNFASNAPATYNVTGIPGPESNGKLQLNSSGGEVTINFQENAFNLAVAARLNTSITGGATGLNSNSTFIVTGVFDLILPDPSVIPGVTGDRYLIRLTDAVSGVEGNDIVELRVVRRSNGQLFIEFRDVNDPANTNLLIDSIALETNHDQIALRLSHLSASSNAITGSFAYGDVGVFGPFTTFAPTIDIFSDESFTRPLFRAASQVVSVPEPSSLLLMGIGLIGLARFSRKRFRR